MLIYEGTKGEFLNSVLNDSIAIEIEQKLLLKMNRKVNKSEFRSWDNSMQYMYKVLSDNEIPENSGVAIEYNIPLTSKRIDFIVTGYNHNKSREAVIIELKQWEAVETVEGKDALVKTYLGSSLREVVHPSYQVWSYAELVDSYNEKIQTEDVTLAPCAYLHNYIKQKDDPIENKMYEWYLKKAPVFGKGEVQDLRSFIKKCIKYGDNKEILYFIENGKIRPSKSLQISLKNMMLGNQEFNMIDEQKVVYEQVLKGAIQSKTDGKKRVHIIKGGPGTGKSVVAINLLVQLTSKDYFCHYVSKNSAPRHVYSYYLKGSMKRSAIDNLFKGPGTYIDVDENILDVVIVDEAHRLNEKSGIFGNLGENQIKEIIFAANYSVFFIDERQRVHIKDKGSVAEIEHWAKKLGAEVEINELTSQFRCSGSDGYLAWLDSVLDIRETANDNLGDIDYLFQVVDSPKELQDTIVALNKERNGARILAGYCWNWMKIHQNDKEYKDIKIDDFEMSWNLGNTKTYVIDKESVNQVGCIHTSQGLEVDYVGVIIGEDMKYENDQIITDFNKRAKSDTSLKGIKKMYKENPDEALKIADEIIKNTYRTLMTRGMKGCYVYCVDENLKSYLKNSMERR